MDKNVRKIRPSNYWRIGEHESWFSDMALKGLHLRKMGIYFAHFEQGEPRRMEYRIEVTKNKGISDEQIELYEENGWEYVTSYQYFHVFESPEERNAIELHTDFAEQSYTLQQLDKRLSVNSAAIFLGTSLIIGMLAALWFVDGTPVLRLVEGPVVQQSIMSLIYVYYMYTSIRALRAIRALRRDLKEGKAINHHAPWEKSLRKNTAFSVVFVGIAIAGFLLALSHLVKMDTYTMPNGDTHLPIVRLADIENNPMLVRDEHYSDDGIDWANRYSTNWSLFAPVQYETDESGMIEGMAWLDESGTYSPSISSEVYELTFQAFASPLLSDLIKWYSYGDETEPFLEKKHSGFDKLIVYEEAEKKQIFASKNNVVIFIRYYGYAKLDTIIENAAEKIRLLTDE
ncbi:DUF2812 domain-containing protein [Solibacillus silvestris]|uniref:DUF2812 domain-containing protein n=1 Tax=Solibacillus silvestris TaxID=76853 RepID=UPI003F7F87ED